MFQPRVVRKYRLSEDDSYKKVSEDLVNTNTLMFIINCCILFISLMVIILGSTYKYHEKEELVNWLYFASAPVYLVLMVFVCFKLYKCTRTPRKEKERRDREQQLSNVQTNGPSNLHPHPQESQPLPEYTETNK
ncbi:hypothetical protein SPOG_03897 [Schizosaccharomyces cryophilus OY26]|uniref:Uncharacterized protein n=1 Tax=Schizosaccharomyces cryophilus (strain OY26 / ATCC MYA-4695 / CBS 11777 / NBRC 106824 / NRRL Y48691) TaxID=653667 RepID=S9W6C7_SCHCR|nr:uncharacterized protein SPOG_03897 [Schizosaccharomyces cryophilus OY26]EPY53370.1 hypothetical protein SPOG_03897 [Schizosaccharomyces cryophilus OY26]